MRVIKVRGLIAKLLIVAVAATAGAVSARPPVAREGGGAASLTAEEVREARAVAENFIRRFGETKDFGPLIDEFFVPDFAARLGGETAEGRFLLMVAPETAARADAADLRRHYCALMNNLFLVETYGRVAAYGRNQNKREEEEREEPDYTDALPPHVLATLKRDPWLAQFIKSEPSGAAAAADAAEREGPERDQLIRGVDRLRAINAVLEEAAAGMRAGTKSLPAWPVANLFGQDLPAGTLGGEGEGAAEVRLADIDEPFRGEPAGARIVCARALMFHLDLVKVDGHFKVLDVAHEEYGIRGPEDRQREAKLDDLLRAIRTGDRETFDELLAANINVNAGEPDGGSTPLHYAAMYGRPGMLKALVAGGADVNARNRHGNTILIYAVGDAEMLLCLLQAGADVNARNADGQTALHAALRYDNQWSVEAARILKSFGARE